jgi:polysaccharide biosynthesis transport protein
MESFDNLLPGETAHRISGDGHWRGVSDTVDLRAVLAKFWARKRLILTSTLLCAGLGLAVAKLITPTYTGDAFVMIMSQRLSEPASDASVRAAIQGGPEAVETEAFVLQSRALAGKTIERLHLDRDPEFNPSLRKPNPLLALLDPVFDQVLVRLEPVTGWLFGAADAPAASDEVPAVADANNVTAIGKPSTGEVDAFMSRLGVAVQQNSNVIQVSFKSSRPMTAALVPNTLIELYIEQRLSEQGGALARESERLDKVVLPALREKVRVSESALADYRQKSGLVGDQNQTILGQELSETKAQLAIAHARTVEAALRLSQAQSTSPTGTAVSPESPALQLLRGQEVDLQGQLAALRSSLGATNPKTLAAEAQLKGLRDGMRREDAGFVGRQKAELAAAQATEAALNKRVAEFSHQFAQVNGGDTQLQSLIGEADADRKTYEGVLGTLERA